MKVKKVLMWLLILVMCLTMVGCQNSDAKSPKKENKPVAAESAAPTETPPETTSTEKTSAATPLLYRVTDDDGNVAWLFGSIHVGREDYYPLPAYVKKAFDQADSLAVEADIVAYEKDIRKSIESMSSMVYTDGSKIGDHISEELYQKSVKILRELVGYVPAMDLYGPSFWSSMIESMMLEKLGADVNLGVDRQLILQAGKDEKEIQEIESAEKQLRMMADFSDEIQELLLKEAVKLYEKQTEAQEQLEEMMDIWAKGDAQEFAEFLAQEDDDLSDEEKKLYAEYDRIVVTQRNLTMTEYAEKALRSGKQVFICVGAAHVVGDGAMVQLLSQRGYKVEQVAA